MSLSSYNPSDRYRQRSHGRIMAFVRALFFVVCAGVFGFWLGGVSGNQEFIALQAERDVLRKQRIQLQQDLTQIRAESQTASLRLEQLQRTYKEVLPEGPVRELMGLVKQQLEEGMDPERLSLAIRSARPPRNCSAVETRRFVVSTPAYQGPDSKISVAENMITITGSGTSARNEKGQPESWYDPSKSIHLVFSLTDNKTQPVKGALPLHHSVVVGTREYRFTISEGAKSFAKVTFDSCDHP